MQQVQIQTYPGLTEGCRRRLQHEIKNQILQYYKVNVGQGIEDLAVIIVRDMLIIRANGILSKTEKFIHNSPKGHDIIKSFRKQVFEQGCLDLIPYYEDILSAKIIYHTVELDPEQDIAVQVMIFDRIIYK